MLKVNGRGGGLQVDGGGGIKLKPLLRTMGHSIFQYLRVKKKDLFPDPSCLPFIPSIREGVRGHVKKCARKEMRGVVLHKCVLGNLL